MRPLLRQSRALMAVFIIAEVSLSAPPARSQNQSSGFVIVPNRLSNGSAPANYQDIVRDVKRTGQTNLQLNVPPQLLPTTTAASGAVSHSTSVNSYDVFFADAARLKANADEIAKIVSNEPADQHSVLYDMQKKYQSSDRGAKIIVPRNISDFITATGMTTSTFSHSTMITAPAVTGLLTVNEAIASDLKQAAKSPANWLDEKSAQLITSSTVLENAAARSAAAQPLAKSYSAVISQFMKAVAAPGDDGARQGYVDAAAAFKSDYATQWPNIKNDAVARQAAADSYNGLARQRVLKAQYGALTNFSPLSYEQVFYFSRRVVTLLDGSGVICSGIALNKRWIISAGHCFTNRSWSDVRVSFDMDGLGTASRPLQILDQWPEPAPGSNGSDVIDFAFVRVEEDAAVSAVFAELDARVHATPYGAEPLCLRSTPVTYKQPVFAIGYPFGGAKLVHDYAYVWFPYKINEPLYNQMGSEIFAQARAIEKQLGRTSYAEFVKQEFEAAYGKTALEGGQTYHYYYDNLGTALRPSFGIDTDTSGGDSGSPVFDRTSRCIVGVFSGGQRDTLVASDASWRQHEIATPVSEVLKQVRATDRAQKVGDRTLDDNVLAARDELLQRLTEVTDIR